MHLERELKFRLDPRAMLRVWRLVPSASRFQQQRLESVYYDTPDLRLHRAGAALRLRRMGRVWLQTLKAPQGAQTALAARAEWEMKAPRGRLDCALFPREEVRGATGVDIVRIARRLRPLFSTRFERRAAALALGHGVRAEACVDEGVIEAGGERETILELELELKDGELGPLIGLAESLVGPLGLRIETESKAERGYRLCRSSGPRPPLKWARPPIAENTAASDAFVKLCAAALAQIGSNASGMTRGGDTEYLHQLRVGVRRLRSATRAFRPLLRRARAREVGRRWRRMMRAFGAARDWDVFCETLIDAGAAPALLARARARRSAARRQARRVVISAGFQKVQLRALRWLYGDPWKSDAARAEPFARFAARALEGLHARLVKRAHHIDWRNEPRRHAVRIEVKRLRYGCDFFAACFPHQAVQPFLARLASLQDTLGELNDVAVARRLLQALASREESPELRSGRLRARRWFGRRERELISALEPAWSALEAKRPYWRAKKAPRARR